MVPTFLAREEIAGFWWDLYRGPSGRLIGVCDELKQTVEGDNRNDLEASAHEVVSLLEDEDTQEIDT